MKSRGCIQEKNKKEWYFYHLSDIFNTTQHVAHPVEKRAPYDLAALTIM